MFLTRARALADNLLPAFQRPSGPVPASHVNLASGAAHDRSASSVLAEVGSVQLEFVELSAATGDPRCCAPPPPPLAAAIARRSSAKNSRWRACMQHHPAILPAQHHRP